jgi:hypothetical protein
MLRCAASFVIAAYAEVRLIPQDLRALPAELFTKPSEFAIFPTFYEFRKHNFPSIASDPCPRLPPDRTSAGEHPAQGIIAAKKRAAADALAGGTTAPGSI